MKKYLFLSLWLILLLAACQPAPDQTAAQPPLASTSVAPTPTLAVTTSVPDESTAVPTTAATAVPQNATAVATQPTLSHPQFSNLTLLPKGSSDNPEPLQPYVPFTTVELYAIWDYSGMTATDQVERLWYFNGDLWLERSEPWDMAKYGANGRVEDIYLYDYEPKLRSGDYRLVLKVNGVELASAEHTIPAFTAGPISHPDTVLIAAVQNHKTLVVRQLDGTTAAWESFGDIVDLAWLPGGQYLVYSEQIVVNPELPGTLGLRHNLWRHNVTTGLKQLLATTDEDLHSPVVSPDGRHLALYSGTLYGDACFVDANLHIMALTADGQRADLIDLADFSGLPVVDGAMPQPNLFGPGDGPFDPVPGEWIDDQTLATRLVWYCSQSDAAGVYALDVDGRTAEKTGELEHP
ncbi:MAG: hypothetical protein IPM53_08400 [Anaerolineaceae bacterium]|nr:hypothetical protein [Anaerolineaceae bacterium]